MAIVRDSVGAEQIGPEVLSKSFREARYGYEPFAQVPFSWTVTTNGYGDPTGTTGNENAFHTGRNNFVWHVKGTQTIVVPSFTTDGFYDFGLDQTLNDGFELLVGGSTGVTTGGNNPAHYKMGTDEAFFRLLFSAEDISGADLLVGFRKVAAFTADWNDYTDLAALRVLGDSSSAAGAVSIETILNNAATSQTATGDTVADATATEFLVEIRGRTARFFVNGASPSTDLTTFVFDDTDVVTPFVFFLNTTDVVGELKLRRAEWGLLADKPASTLTVP